MLFEKEDEKCDPKSFDLPLEKELLKEIDFFKEENDLEVLGLFSDGHIGWNVVV